MKRIKLFLLAFLFFNMYAQSQETDTRKERKRIKSEQKQMKNLDLNDNQGQQIKEINSRYRDAHKQIMQNDALTQEQKQEQIQALNKKRVADIHTIVGPDKAQTFDRNNQNEKEKKKVKEEKKNQKMEKQVKEKKEKKSKKG